MTTLPGAVSVLVLALAAAIGSCGCATIDRETPRPESFAITQDEAAGTELGRRWAEAEAKAKVDDPSLSAFRLLPNSLEAMAARVALVNLAERTLDLQYYIFDADETGLFLAERLLAAADRGVRVRILLDDMYAHGVEESLLAFDAHPRIEVRLFNPWAERGGALGRGMEFLFTPRLNHRMHNKLFIGDGVVGIFGGRNIADEYFDLDEAFEYKDFDVAAAGPVVAQGSALFDAFWNGPDAIPLDRLSIPRASTSTPAERLESGRADFAAHRERMKASPYARAVEATTFVQELATRSGRWVFARGELLGDSPDKTRRADDPTWRGSLGRSITQVTQSAQREVVASSPYFVPRDAGARSLAALVDRGVEVTILTNSFAANDVPLVHANYARYRSRLVRDGIRLFELRRRAAQDDLGGADERPDDGRAFGSANASLHAKTFVIDRERVFIGSMNLDPRSWALNTEVGILIDSPELAESVAESILSLTAPDRSYRLAIGPVGELVWIGQASDGREVIFRSDPGTSFWDRLVNGLLGLLPIEGQT